jgi:hypothetical protein
MSTRVFGILDYKISKIEAECFKYKVERAAVNLFTAVFFYLFH